MSGDGGDGGATGGSAAVLLVPDLALERWPSMERYATALARRLPSVAVAEEARTIAGPRYLARYVRYPRALRRHRPRVVHITDHSYAHCLRSFRGVPSLVTIHDLQPVREVAARRRGPRDAARALVLNWVTAWLRRADRWCAVSAFTAAEARALLGLPEERVAVVHSGVDEAFFAPPDAARVADLRAGWLARTGGQGSGVTRVVLHVGSCAPRKNVEAAFAALAALRRGGCDARLVQAGGRFSDAQRAALGEAGAAPAVLQVPRLPEPDLLDAYHAADALVIPSTYEGFGLPALEAQAAGIPVVANRAGGLPEAVGDAGVLVDGSEPGALAAALARVLEGGALRESLVAAGRARARRFGWDATAAAVSRLYTELGA